MTDRQELERLLAIIKQMRDAQHAYFRNRKTAAPSHAKNLLDDARMKENSLDVLVAQLEKKGYRPDKHEGVQAEQGNMF